MRTPVEYDGVAAGVRDGLACLICGRDLVGRQRKFCRNSHKVRWGEIQREKRTGRPRQQSGFCADCGTPVYLRSARCRSCATRVTNAARRVGAPRPFALNPFCPNNVVEPAECETYEPHAHCECGLPVTGGGIVCGVCVKEQARVEFKTWEVVA